VSPASSYRQHHPKWYRAPVSVWWWLEQWRFTKFVLRELTSLFVGFAAFVYLWQLRALVGGAEAYGRFLEAMRNPGMVALHAVTIVAVLFHAITWFNLTPRAMDVRARGRKVPDRVVIAMNYAGWFAVSAAVVWILMRG
jgi:fumarate reductase subunit C